MANMKYYFEVNRNGDPVEGSNIRTNRPPKSNYKRWKEIVTHAQVCCNPKQYELEVSAGRAVRYWVKDDENGNPISGTLTKHANKPVGAWTEVVGNYCCDDAPTVDEDIDIPMTTQDFDFNIIEESGATDAQGDTVTIFGHDVGDEITSTEGDMTIVINSLAGEVTATVDDDAADTVGTFPLTLTDGKGHHRTFSFTVTYTAPEA